MPFQKRIFLFLLFHWFLVYSAVAESKYDSLKQLLSNEVKLENKFVLCERLFHISLEQGKNEAEYYFQQCVEFDKKLTSPVYEAKIKLMKTLLEIRNTSPDIAIQKLEKLIPDLNNSELTYYVSDVYSRIGNLFLQQSNYKNALKYYEISDSIAVLENFLRLRCENLMMSGKCLHQLGNLTSALSRLHQALKFAEQLKLNNLISQICTFIGSIYSDSKNKDFAVPHLSRALKIAVEQKDTSAIVQAYVYLGNNSFYGNKYQESLKYYSEALKIEEKKNIASAALAGLYGNIGNSYGELGDHVLCLEYQQKAVGIFENLNDKTGLAICYTSIAVSNLKLKKYQESLLFFQKAQNIAIEIESPEDLVEIYSGLSTLYGEKGDFEKAYLYHKKFHVTKDSLYNAANERKLTELELSYQFENTRKEIENKQKLEKERLQKWIFGAVFFIVVLIVISIVIFRAYKITRRQKFTIEGQKILIEERNEELFQQNEEIKSQRDEIEAQRNQINNQKIIAENQRDEIFLQKKEITDSITYAKNIQKSILREEDIIRNNNIDSFILFKPRDIVSGDFYWFKEIAINGNRQLVIAAADCTGHGVPGAFMSMLGTAFLSEIVTGFINNHSQSAELDASDILDQLRELIIKSLHQTGKDGEQKDGMDIALCVVDFNKSVLQFAGANNPLYIFSEKVDNGNQSYDLVEIKADKQPISIYLGEKIKFQNHKINIKNSDSFYIFSDGFVDQFGGPNGKKFMSKKLKCLLKSIQGKTMFDQRNILDQAFESWRGTNFQVDDVLVIGFKVIV